MPIADVLELARPLTPLSLTDFDDDQLSEWEDISFSPRQVELLSQYQEGESAQFAKITMGQILMASVKWGMPIADVLELARPLARLSLTDFDDDQLSEWDSVRFSLRQVQLLSRDLDGEGPWLKKVGTKQLMRASGKWGMTIEEVLELARPLVKLSLMRTPEQ